MTTLATGRIVQYTLSVGDANAINKRLQDALNNIAKHREASDGSIVYVGNVARPGDTYPAMIVNLNGASVNLQVFVDGNYTYWATSRSEGDQQGQFLFPVVTR